MRTITISELGQFAYGPHSTLKNHRTWWGRPIYSIDVIQERLAVSEGFKAVRYPSGKVHVLRGPDGLSQQLVEEIVLAGGKPKAPRLDVMEAIVEYWQTIAIIGVVAMAIAMAAIVIRPMFGY